METIKIAVSIDELFGSQPTPEHQAEIEAKERAISHSANAWQGLYRLQQGVGDNTSTWAIEKSMSQLAITEDPFWLEQVALMQEFIDQYALDVSAYATPVYAANPEVHDQAVQIAKEIAGYERLESGD